jgi:hypothetical protein
MTAIFPLPPTRYIEFSAHAQTVILPDHGTAGEHPEPDDLRAAILADRHNLTRSYSAVWSISRVIDHYSVLADRDMV